MFSLRNWILFWILLNKLNGKKKSWRLKRIMLTILEMLIYKRPMTVCLKSFGILNCRVMMWKMLLQMLGIKCQLSKDVVGKAEKLVVQQFSKLCQLTGACVAHSIWKWQKKFSRNLDMLMSFKQDKRLTLKIGLYSTLSTVHRGPPGGSLITIMKESYKLCNYLFSLYNKTE